MALHKQKQKITLSIYKICLNAANLKAILKKIDFIKAIWIDCTTNMKEYEDEAKHRDKDKNSNS